MNKKAKAEITTDIMFVKYREKELDPALLDRINTWLGKKRNCDPNFVTYDLIDKLIILTEEKGSQYAVNYFRWRNEGTMTWQELSSSKQENELIINNNDVRDLNKRIGDMQEQLNDMQKLILNIGFYLNDELKDRRLRVV